VRINQYHCFWVFQLLGKTSNFVFAKLSSSVMNPLVKIPLLFKFIKLPAVIALFSGSVFVSSLTGLVDDNSIDKEEFEKHMTHASKCEGFAIINTALDQRVKLDKKYENPELDSKVPNSVTSYISNFDEAHADLIVISDVSNDDTGYWIMKDVQQELLHKYGIKYNWVLKTDNSRLQDIPIAYLYDSTKIDIDHLNHYIATGCKSFK
jgi:hypothetical protein